jgi:hypothetical protein
MGEFIRRRALVWVPAGVHEAGIAAWKAAIGPAVVVPVESGTVFVPMDVPRRSDATSWSWITRNAGGAAVVIVWDTELTIQVTFSRRWPGPATTNQLAPKLARAFQVEEDVVSPHLDQVAELFEAVGKPDVAAVARRVLVGDFDRWRRPWLAYSTRSRIGIACMVVLSVAMFFGTRALDLPDWLDYWPPLVLMSLTMALLPFYLFRWQRVDRVLPLDDQSTSDSQSAK